MRRRGSAPPVLIRQGLDEVAGSGLVTAPLETRRCFSSAIPSVVVGRQSRVPGVSSPCEVELLRLLPDPPVSQTPLRDDVRPVKSGASEHGPQESRRLRSLEGQSGSFHQVLDKDTSALIIRHNDSFHKVLDRETSALIIRQNYSFHEVLDKDTSALIIRQNYSSRYVLHQVLDKDTLALIIGQNDSYKCVPPGSRSAMLYVFPHVIHQLVCWEPDDGVLIVELWREPSRTATFH